MKELTRILFVRQRHGACCWDDQKSQECSLTDTHTAMSNDEDWQPRSANMLFGLQNFNSRVVTMYALGKEVDF